MMEWGITLATLPAEVPSPQPLSIVALIPRPLVPIRQWAEYREVPDCENSENRRNLETPTWAKRGCQKVKYCTKQ
jgi:hypothetical protein